MKQCYDLLMHCRTHGPERVTTYRKPTLGKLETIKLTCGCETPFFDLTQQARVEVLRWLEDVAST